MKFVIGESGQIRTIHSDDAMPILRSLGGEVTIRRASHVEPYSGLSLDARTQLPASISPDCTDWFADMTPSGGPVGGPFATRQAALDWERDWLFEHGIPQLT